MWTVNLNPKQDTFRKNYILLLSWKINNSCSELKLNKKISIYDLIEKNDFNNEIKFQTDTEFVKFLKKHFEEVDEYLSFHIPKWFYEYKKLFYDNPHIEKVLDNILYEFYGLFNKVNLPKEINYNTINIVIEYMDYYLSDCLIDKPLNYVESSLIYELKQSIIALLLYYNENKTLEGFYEEFKLMGNPIEIYNETYNINIINILNKITKD